MRAVVLAHPGDLATRTGGFGYDRRLLEGLAALGHPVRALALPGRYPDAGPQDRAAAAAAFRGLADGSVVLVDMLAGAVLPDIFEAEARRLLLVALCHHPLSLETGLDAGTAAAYAASERRALAAARAVIVTSPATAAILAADFGQAGERVTVAVPGTDPRPAAPANGDPPVILTVATLTRRKAHDVLIDALARLGGRRFAARFVGGDRFDPAWAAGLREQVAAAGLADRVTFSGEVEDPAGAFADADLFVLPSRFEGYGMVFAEALAHGLPVIAARAGAVPDVVPEAAGALVPPDDPQALAEAIARLLDDPAARRSAARAARAAGMRLPDWPATAGRVARLIEGLAP